MKRIFFSKDAINVYSGFFTNIAAAWFLAIFISRNLLELTSNILAFIIALALAVILGRKR